MSRIAVILGSTRPGRVSPVIAERVVPALTAASHEVEIIDLEQVALPMFDEPLPPMAGQPAHEHTKAWGAKVAQFDGFVIVTPEYNAGYPAVLKNAIDFLAAEWNDKPVGVVAYGWHKGARVASALSPVLANVKMREVDGVGIQFGEHVVDGAWSSESEVLASVDKEFAGLAERLGAALA